MGKKLDTSTLLEGEQILHDRLIDYDGAPLIKPRQVSPLKSKAIDDTTCLFPFEVNVPLSAEFPLGKRSIPCGHCEDCLRRKRNEWFFRIQQEAKNHINVHFVTLTYDDESLYYNPDTGYPSVCRRDIQLFFKQLRKLISPARIRYFGISEYGPNTHRPHYHLILFGWPCEIDAYDTILRAWGRCSNITISPLVDAQMMYVCRYHTDKGYTPHGRDPTFTFMSRNPGIGYCYSTKSENIAYHLADVRRSLSAPLQDGGNTSLGRYLRRKIYGKEFICPVPEINRNAIPLSRSAALENYYFKKAMRRAKKTGKI